MTDISYSIVSATGDEIDLATSAIDSKGFGLLVDSKGLGLAERDARISASAAGDGGRLRAVRVPPRSATLEVLVHDTKDATLRTNYRRLAAAIRHVPGKPSPKLRAEYTTGEVYESAFTYQNGADDEAGQDGSGTSRLPLNVIFPDPYWTARDALQFRVSGVQGTDGLLPYLAELPLSPSTASGNVTVQNTGDAIVSPVWVLTGPATRVTATSGTYSWTARNIAAGEVVTIDTSDNTVKLGAAGTNVYDRMDPAPKFFGFAPGASAVSVVIDGGTTATSVACFYRPRLEVIV